MPPESLRLPLALPVFVLLGATGSASVRFAESKGSTGKAQSQWSTFGLLHSVRRIIRLRIQIAPSGCAQANTG